MVRRAAGAHPRRMDDVRATRETVEDLAVGLLSWSLPVLVLASYSRYRAGTGHLFVDPFGGLTLVAWTVLFAATVARTAGQTRRVGVARAARVLGAGAAALMMGLLSVALTSESDRPSSDPAIAPTLVGCVVAVFGGWAIGRLGWAEPEPSLPALRRLLRLAQVRLPLVLVSIGAYLAWRGAS